MSYCTLEEAWGPDFKRKKKSRKENKLETQEKKMLKDSIDPQILIPQTHRMADYRKDITQDDLPKTDTSNIGGYDNSFDSYISPYQRYSADPIQQSNESVLEYNKKETVSLSNDKRIFSNNEESEIVKTSKEQIKNIIQTKPIL